MRNADPPTVRLSSRAWVVWAVAVLAYACSVFQRTSLSVAAGPATERFHIGASVLSTFAVLQLVGYAGMQIPVGILTDRFGPRVIMAAGAVVMAGGQVMLALTHAPAGALVARLLVGTGDAAAFISVLRLIPAWFPARRVPLVTQITGQLGQTGQVASAIPLVAALSGPGWTATYLGAGTVSLLVAILIVLAIRDQPPGTPPPAPPGGWRVALTNLRASFLHPGTRLGLWSHFSTQFSAMVFGLLWGFPFMTIGLGYSPQLAGALLSVMVVGSAVIGPGLGQLTGRYPMRRSNLVLGILLLTVAAWTLVLLWPGRAPLGVMVLLMLVLSACGPASAVGFDFARSFNPAARLGAASGIVNMGGFTASLITIFVIGLILDTRAPDGHFSVTDFKLAFCFQYVLWAFGLVSLWRARRLTRAGLRAEGTTIDPLHHAVARHWRARHHD